MVRAQEQEKMSSQQHVDEVLGAEDRGYEEHEEHDDKQLTKE